MSKFSMILLSALVSGTMAQASINFDMRADYLSNDYDDLSTSADNSQFKLNAVRVDAKGKLNDSVDYRLRFRFDKDRAVVASNQRDNIGGDVDLAYLTNKFGDSMALTLGKFASDSGGNEGTTSSIDLYMQTLAYSSLTMGTAPFRYYTGAKFAYIFMEGNEVAVHAADLNTDSTGTGNTGTGTTFNQNKFMTGVVYKGSFMDKKLMPIVSYHTQTYKTTATTNAAASEPKNNYLAAGIKYDIDMFTVEADYLMNTLGSATTNAQDDKLDTVQVGFAYKLDQWTPRVKLESTTTKNVIVGVESKTAYTGIQAGVEFKPVKEDMFRYHVMYHQREAKADAYAAVAAKTTTDKFIIVGTRINADFLK